jgi:hypothetical protein
MSDSKPKQKRPRSKIKTRFDQDDKIVLAQTKQPPRLAKVKGRAKGRPPGSPNKPKVDDVKAFGIDYKKFVKELKSRPGTSDLYKMADTMLAGVIFANAIVIEEVREAINTDGVNRLNIENSKLMIAALKGATAEVTNSLKALGLAAGREPDVDDNNIRKVLADLDLSKELPPQLQHAYLKAIDDINKTEGDLSKEAQVEQSGLMSKIRKPIIAYERGEEPAEEANSVILNPNTEGLHELG